MSIYDAYLLLVPVLGGYLGYRIGVWAILRTLKDLALDLAAVEERLLREAKRRGAIERWEGKPEERQVTPEEVDAFRKGVVGAPDASGWLWGKEGGVRHGSQ